MVSVLLFIVVFINLLLGIFILSRNYKSHINVSFAIFVFGIVLWMIVNFYSNFKFGYDTDFFVNKLIFHVSLYISFGLLYFSLVFPRPIFKWSFNQVIFLLIPVFVGNFLVASNQVINKISYLKDGTTGVEFGGGIFVWSLILLSYILFSFVLILIKLRRFKGIERVQLEYLLLGFIIFLFSAITLNFIIPFLFNIFWITNFGPFFTLSIVGFTSYVIVKHRFLDIRLVIARTVAYFILVFILALLYTTSLFIITTILFPGIVTNNSQTVIYIILSLCIAVTLEPLRHYLERVSDKFFFQQKYDSQILLQELGRALTANIELSDSIKSFFEPLIRAMKLSGGLTILINNNMGDESPILWEENIGDVLKITNPQDKAQITKLIQSLGFQQKDEILIYSELSEGEEKELLRRNNIEVIAPLIVGKEIIGGILLSPKVDGRLYSSTDIKVIRIIIPEFAVAMKNALSYDQIKKFNITLEGKVNEATKDLKIANEKLKEIDKLKDEFVSLASHELRTPMTVIKSYVWLLLQGKAGEISEKQKTYLDRTFSSTNRLINMVNDMLNISRIESGRLIIDAKPIDMSALVEDTVIEMQTRAAEQDIKIIFDPPVAPLPQVLADNERIKQVLINLIGNSLKFTPPQGTISVELSVKDGLLLTSVKDTGQGIKKEDMEKLFKKFNMLGGNHLTKQSSQGTGLGLYLSKSLIELHKGRIWVESEGEGKGSVFSFTLPIIENKTS